MLAQLLREQQDPTSPNFHKWITPEEFADRFGASDGDVKQITTWLESQGLTVSRVARGRNWIGVSGTADQVRNAFETEIHGYEVSRPTTSRTAPADSFSIACSSVFRSSS